MRLGTPRELLLRFFFRGRLLPESAAEVGGEIGEERRAGVAVPVLETAQRGQAVHRFAREIERTRRRVNALEYILIPEAPPGAGQPASAHAVHPICLKKSR